jgi:hypothetical protein
LDGRICQKKDCHLPGFSVFLSPMAPCGARGEPVSLHLSQVKNKQQTKLEEQMKFNKWTLGLAAVGAVSMASAVRADEAKLVPLNTAVSSTVISGYVDVAAQYNPGSPSPKDSAIVANQPFGLPGQVDGFGLNDVVISLDKPLDESPWAAGYHVDLNWGLDAINLSGPVRQAYVTMRTPVGNGIDWKIGGFDGVTGYEGNTGYSNPNYTRSYGYQVNPASELGIIASYKIVDGVTVQMGMAQRGGTFAILGQTAVGLSSKDYLATLALTAPDSWGWLKGSTVNLGVVQGFDNGAVNNYSANVTLATPVTGLKFGLAYDNVQTLTQKGGFFFPSLGPDLDWNISIYGAYITYQATEKLAFNVRGEYVDISETAKNAPNLEELTATVEYDLWANVVSRLEVRWDHSEGANLFNNGGYVPAGTGTGPSVQDAFLIALNVVYKF